MADVSIPTIATVTPASGDTVLGVQGGAVKRMGVGAGSLAAAGVTTTFTKPQIFQDTASESGSLVDVRHYADGTGNITSPGQTYGVDIHNYNGAADALVIHQYSAASTAALRIDNTDNKPAIAIYNTENLTLNPDGIGSGDAFKFDDHGTTRFIVTGEGRVAISPKDSITTHAVAITGSTAAQTTLRVTLNASAIGVNIVANAAAAGSYPFQVSGQDYGPRLTTSTNGGDALTINKSGTGSGRVVVIANSGTGLSLDIRNGSASLFAVTAAGLPQWVAAANQQTTVGAAGAAAALPAAPAKYLKVVDSAGTTYVIPAYAAS